jgi:hypothetical protein
LSISAVLLVALYIFVGRELTSADLPAPAQRSYSIAENESVDVTLAASHTDGLPGCTELSLATANVTGGTLDSLNNVSCSAGASLAADMDDAVTSIPVLSTTGFQSTGTLRINDEIIVYTDTTDTSFDLVLRGQFGTSPAAHTAGDVAAETETESAPLAQPHTDLDTTMIVTGTGLGFPASGVLQIENEFITYTSRAEVDNPPPSGVDDSTAFTVGARGAFGSTPDPYVDETVRRAVAVSTSLSAGITGASTEIPVDDITGFGDPEGGVQINNELISYTGVGETALDCAPVADPCLTGATVAGTHQIGDTVFQLSDLDTDVATTTFNPGSGAFARTATLTWDVSDADVVLPVSTSILLPAADIFPASGTIAIGDEIVSYSGISPAVLTCDPFAPPCFTGVTRGTGGTTAVPHSTGATIYQAFFSYTAGHNPTSDPVVVGVEVTPINDPPVTDHQEFNLQAPAPVPVEISATDLDGDSGEHITGDCDLGFTVAVSPVHGALSPITNSPCTSNAPNTDDNPNEDTASLTYTPDADFFGQDSFAVLICDDVTCVTANVDVNISADSPSPTATASPTPTATPDPSATPGPPLPFDFGDLDCDDDVDAVDALSILLKLAGFPQIISDNPDCPTLGGE